ncbi:MAG: hypothetical protein GWN71_45510, partial [Gammaproteobacteria bacterium]|nr:hypothetical protein [Gemmatimonadota bacterium]NIU80535.1 hypothetical protein [Gammaproteobacteria bacterium]
MIKGTGKERDAIRTFGQRSLPDDIEFGLGTPGAVPGDDGSSAVTFDNDQIEFDDRGITMPFGTR